MAILVTGAAGFIGSAVTLDLLDRGETVVGVDDLNGYYSPALKQARLDRLLTRKNFFFHRGNISDPEALRAAKGTSEITKVVHLAAQVGVRYSLDEPRVYVNSNVAGHLEVLEFCRSLGAVEHLVYASSSSVYGGNKKVPFSEADRVDDPVSLYAATKRAAELMSRTYTHLFGIPQTGLRYFTVYGPWGRPDMAYWLFTAAILEGRPIRVFNFGRMWRDFTYIDDIVRGTIKVLDNPPTAGGPQHRLYNIGNSNPEELDHFITVLEQILGRKAIREYEPLQPGEVERTCADVTGLDRDFGFVPTVPLEVGLERFATWYREFHHC